MSEEKSLHDSLVWPKKVTEEKYPWDEWFNGNVWKLKPGEDFVVGLRSFRSAIYMAAKRYGYRVKTHVTRKQDLVYIQKVGKARGK